MTKTVSSRNFCIEHRIKQRFLVLENRDIMIMGETFSVCHGREAKCSYSFIIRITVSRTNKYRLMLHQKPETSDMSSSNSSE